ncbi:MAG TPA: LysM peptidoglycan-binding domain-containing protein [Chromatiales bacterium]|nr:LysM peptidoglycan-binding domain-containing protein [Chromatiales bacterium]
MKGYELKTVLLMLVALSIAGCGSLIHYKVQQGDTLYSIGWRYGKDPKQIAEWNNLKAPYIIHEGQMLRIAPPPDQANPATIEAVRSREATATVAGRQRSTGSSTPPQKSPPTSVGMGPIVWGWPAEGVLISTFSAKKLGRNGIDIGGKMGTPVRAAARGKVVYSGNGLSSYGNLLIIKHNESFLSAYAHNDRLLVKEGELVKQGQKIASMGATGSERVMLHFEIRYNGKPVDPQRYLPKR